MNLVFNVAGSASEDRRIKNSGFQNYYPSINKETQFDAIKPYIKLATENFIIPYIGLASYNELVDASTPNANQTQALEYIKQAVADYTIYLAIPKMASLISDMGIVDSSNNNTVPVPQWKSDQVRWECLKNADVVVDRLLEFMEDASFSTYKSSDEYLSQTNIWFRSTSLLTQYINITGRRAYIKLLPSLNKAARMLTQTLCSEKSTVLGLLEKASPTDIEKEMLDLCREYIANKGLYLAVPHLLLVYEGDGFMFISRNDGINNRSNVGAAFKKEATEQLRLQAELDADEAQAAIIQLLYSDSTTFALWAASNSLTESSDVILYSDDCIGGIML